MPIEQTVDTGTGTTVEAAPGGEAFALPNDFDSYIDEGEAIEIPAEQQPADGGGQQAAEPAPAPAPAGTREGQPQTGTAPQAQPGGQQQQPQQQTVQPAREAQTGDGTVAQPQKIYSPGELATALQQNRAQMIDALAADKFKLTPEEIQALEVDAVGAIPKLLGRAFFEASVNSLQQMATMVPRIVEQVVSGRIQESDAERAFHEAWPNIDKGNADHVRVAMHFANSFRQANPRASLEDTIKFAGHATTTFLGLQPPQATNSNGGQPQRGNGAARQPARRVTPAFAPAAGGRAQAPAGTPTQSISPYSGLGLNFDEE